MLLGAEEIAKVFSATNGNAEEAGADKVIKKEVLKEKRSEKDKGKKEILIHRHVGHKHLVSSCGTLRIALLFTFSCWRAENLLTYFS